MAQWISIGGKPLVQWSHRSMNFHGGRAIGSIAQGFNGSMVHGISIGGKPLVQWLNGSMLYPVMFRNSTHVLKHTTSYS